MVLLVGYIYLAREDLEAFLAAMAIIAAGAQAEAGCLFYAFAPDDAVRGRVLIAQRWESERFLDLHLAGPQAAAFQTGWARRVRLAVERYDVSKKHSALQA